MFYILLKAFYYNSSTNVLPTLDDAFAVSHFSLRHTQATFHLKSISQKMALTLLKYFKEVFYSGDSYYIISIMTV